MPRIFTFITLFFLFLLAINGNTATHSNIIEQMESLKRSMVTVDTSLTRTYKSQTSKTAVYSRHGAGVIIDKSGIIATNTHIIINAPLIIVTTANGKTYPAQVLFADRDNDLALLKINSPEPLIPVLLANSDRVSLGAPILALGNSDINHHSILAGEVKTLLQNRKNGSIEFIEINVSMHQGDSGGPVFDRNGRLLGIVMAQHQQNPQMIVIVPANKIRHEYWQHH